MASDNLAIEDITTSQTAKETTANSQTNKLDNATQGRFNEDFATDANKTFSLHADGQSNALRFFQFNLTSTGSLTATRELEVPLVERFYLFENNTTGGQSITIIPPTGTGVTIANGESAVVRCDGTNVIPLSSYWGGIVSEATAEAMHIYANGDVRLSASEAAIATGATGGFPGIPTMAGDASGAPTNENAGNAQIAYDTTNQEIKLYDPVANAWRTIATAAQ